MSKQFSVLLTDVDLHALEGVLCDSGDVEVLSGTPTNDDRSLHPLAGLAIPLSQVGRVSLFCYLAPLGLPRSLFLKRLSPVKVSVDVDRSHLIEFWRPYYNGQIIRTGRLWYQNTLHDTERFYPKNPEFCRWADRVMARVRRSLTYNTNAGAYVGADAFKGLASGIITWKSAITDQTILTVK